MTQEDLNEVLGKSLANYQLRQLAEDGGNLESALTLIDRLESELLNVQEHAQNLEFLLNQKDEKISQLEAKAEAYDRVMSGGKKSLKEWANIFGMAVAVDQNAEVTCFEHIPVMCYNRGKGIWTNSTEHYGEEIYLLPTNLIDFDGNWKDSLTLPDGWEETCSSTH